MVRHAPPETRSMHPLLRRLAVLVPLATAPAALAQAPNGDLIDQTRDLLQKHPDDVAVQVLNGISTSVASMAAADAVRTEMEHRRDAAMRDMDRSALPPAGDIEFPKDWKAKSEDRLKRYGISAEE